MKNIKLFISTAVMVLFMTAFSNQANAQMTQFYKSTVDGSKFKVQFTTNHEQEKIWYKKTSTAEWSSRNVTYSDEEIIKYKRISNGKENIWTLVFTNGNTDHFILNSPNGKTERFELIH